jgi:hypothetical protein
MPVLSTPALNPYPNTPLPRWCAVLLLCLALGACGHKAKDGAAPQADGGTPGGEALPTPAGTAGGVTGMPAKPGPGHVGPPSPDMAQAVEFDENGNPIEPPPLGPDGQPIDPATVPADAPLDPATLPAEPTPDDAAAVVRDYYAAINGGDFARAHGLWADAGRASGKSATQFATGFADTTGISVEVMAPGAIDAGAGQRHIEVPVAFTVTQRDGKLYRYVGAYTLRRTVVDGATAEQRDWRIVSADIRQLDR